MVARWQLLDAGIDRREIEHRVHCRRLRIVHRGVYAVGHDALTLRGRWMAAVLAGGPDAVLSHRAAAALWGMRRWEGRIEVTSPRRMLRGRTIRGYQRLLPADEVTIVDGIPVTTVSRTLLDLATVTDEQALTRAIEQAEILRLSDPLSPAAVLERHAGTRGAGRLRAALGRPLPPITRSDLERRFLTALSKAAVQEPETNVLVAGYEVDFLWRTKRVIVELDGRETHHTTAAFERDRARDRDLLTHGFRVARITWRQLHDDERAVMADMRRLTS